MAKTAKSSSDQIRMMAPTGMLGYGFTEEAFQRGIEMGLDFIGCDAGSMDPGPHYLGEGIPFVSRQAMKRDIGMLLEGAINNNIPLLIGSAGGGGGAPQVRLTREVVEEVAREKGLSFKMALIHSEQDKGYLKQQRRAGKIEPLGPIEELSDAEIDRSHRVVAMMGVEPFQKALEDGAQVVIAGRATDASIYSAIPLMRGFDPGLVWHLAKIIECGGQVVTPRTGQDCVVGTISKDHFVVEPAHPDKRCTRMRIAAHTLYENPSPYRLEEPDGTLVTTHSAYEQIDDRRVKVSGSKFEPSKRYTVKLEGVRHAGYRTVFMAGVRDPILISVINEFIESCYERAAKEVLSFGVTPDRYKMNVRVYGVNATMASREPVRNALPHEVGLLADVLADDPETSKAVMAKLRYALLHTDFPGRKCISGNLAIPFSPSDMHVGAAYEFSVWHRMEITDPLGPFPIEMLSV
jgi:Acyclic terpene utilisation family protein AtuA